MFFPKNMDKTTKMVLVDEWQSMASITNMLVDDLVGEGSNQIYALCAAGYRSSLRVLKHGLQINEVANS